MSTSIDPYSAAPVTVLIVQPEGEFYGACRSMLRTLSALPPGAARPIVCFPCDGTAAEAYRCAGIEVEIVPGIAVLRRQGLRVTGVLRLLLDFVRSSVALARIGRRYRVGLVHSNSAFVLAGVGAARLLRRPHVWHIREVVTDKPALVRALAFAVRHGATVAATVSRAAAGMLDAGQPLVVVPNSYVADAPRPVAERADGRRIILSLGRISATKGQDLLVEAVARLPVTIRRTMEVWVVGTVFPGNEAAAEALIQRVVDLGLRDHVHFIGYVDDPASLLDQADLLCVTTRTGEGFANVALEAMCHEVVVVAASRGGIEELVRDGISGLLTEPGNVAQLATSLERVLSQASLRVQLVEGGLEVASRFDPDSSARQLMSVWGQARISST